MLQRYHDNTLSQTNYLSFSEVLCVYNQSNTPGKLNPSAAENAVSLIADQGGTQRCSERRAAASWGGLSSHIKTAGFNYYQ